MLGGGQGGWRPLFWGIGTGTEEQINQLSATAAIVAKLTLELTTSTRVSWAGGGGVRGGGEFLRSADEAVMDGVLDL